MPPFEPLVDSTLEDPNDVLLEDKWRKMFPICVASMDKSSQFMSRAIFVAFSIVLAKRKILPDEYFAANYITENLKIKSLNYRNEKALKISQLLKECGEAIGLGYLEELALVLSDAEQDETAIEVFAFKLHYFPDGGVVAQMSSEQNGEPVTQMEQLARRPYESTKAVRDQLVVMARSILILCHKILQPLPEGFSATFRIKYTDAAPKDFSVKGFENVSSFYKLPEGIQSVGLGQIRPGFHGALLDCSSIYIENASQAVNVIRRYMDKVAKGMGLSVNQTAQDSTQLVPTATSHSESPSDRRADDSPEETKRAPRNCNIRRNHPYTTINRRRS